ncbi:MAG: hypothetical protein QW165_04325 [Candidatus Woesearchaeota archaeon]
MEEIHAMLGILIVSAIALTGYFVLSDGGAGAAVSRDYLACCCNILAKDNGQVLVRSQIQTFADNCKQACDYNYAGQGKIFAQDGLCAANP